MHVFLSIFTDGRICFRATIIPYLYWKRKISSGLYYLMLIKIHMKKRKGYLGDWQYFTHALIVSFLPQRESPVPHGVQSCRCATSRRVGNYYILFPVFFLFLLYQKVKTLVEYCSRINILRKLRLRLTDVT